MAKHNPLNNLGAFAHPAKAATPMPKTVIPAAVKTTTAPRGTGPAPKPATSRSVAKAMDAAVLMGQNPNNITMTSTKPPAPKATKPMGPPQLPKPGPMKRGK